MAVHTAGQGCVTCQGKMLPAPFTPQFLRRLEVLRLKTRRDVLGTQSGTYTAPRRGTSLEFADYRRYAPGDDLRYLDWGVLARSDRLYVKLFHEEVDLFVYLFIDASGSMLFPSRVEKFVPACQLAFALAYAVLANHDHVSFHMLQQPGSGSASPFYRGRHRILDAIRFVSSFEPAGSLELVPTLGQQLSKIRRPGKAILISDFLMPVLTYEASLKLLLASNFDVSVIQVLSRPEMEPPFPQGTLVVEENEGSGEIDIQWNAANQRQYKERLERSIHELKRFCHQRGIDCSLFVTDEDLTDFVLKILPGIGLFK